jgi:hypothetical protein
MVRTITRWLPRARHAWAIIGLQVAALAAPAPARAQAGTAVLAGMVSDAQGGVLPGVTLTVRNIDTGVIRTASSEADGRYRVAALPPGAYEVRADLKGFASVQVSDITLTIGLEFQHDFTLGLQGLQESVTVSARVPIVETTKSEIGDVLTPQIGRAHV